jgi:hypothetical protein
MNQLRRYGGVTIAQIGLPTEDRISTKSCQVPLLRSETVLVSFRRNWFPGERRKEMTSLAFMLGHPHYASQEALSSR